MKWPCSLQYVGVFPKYLYTTGEGLSPQQNVKYVVKCIEMPKGQNLIEIFSPAPFRVLSLHALRQSVCGRDLGVLRLTFYIFVERTSEINNPLDDLSSNLQARVFPSPQICCPRHWHQTTVKLIFSVPPKKNIVYRDASVSSEICCRKSCT